MDGGRQDIVVTVLTRTRKITGIEAVVVHDVASEHGQVVEDTFDWFAQDRAGNVWYLGEDTTEFENGKPHSTAGSWQAGRDGAQAGIALPAAPRTGLDYRQEYHHGDAEDRAVVTGTDERAQVPFGRFDHVLTTRDTTPLEPDLVERKYYARGVGVVMEITESGGTERNELLSYRPGG